MQAWAGWSISSDDAIVIPSGVQKRPEIPSLNIQVLSVAIVQLPLRDNMYAVPWDLVSSMGRIILLLVIIFAAEFEKQITEGIMAGGVKA